METFQQPQATGVDDAQAAAVVWDSDLVEELSDLLGAEHHGQLERQERANEVAPRPEALLHFTPHDQYIRDARG